VHLLVLGEYDTARYNCKETAETPLSVLITCSCILRSVSPFKQHPQLPSDEEDGDKNFSKDFIGFLFLNPCISLS